MENFSGKNEYKPKSYIEKKPFFSLEQENFLDKEVEEMNYDRLLEDDYEGKINQNTNEVITKEFIEQKKNEVLQARDSHKSSDKIKDLRSEVEENPSITREHRKVGEYLEALFYKKLGGKNGWIPNALVFKLSNYDDYIKGMDLGIETEDGELTLAADVTFSHTKNLTKKLDRIKDFIEKGELPTPTFYERAEKGNKPMPHVVIALEHEKVVKALTLWADNQGDMLDNHPLMAKTLLEIEVQLEASATYAKALGKRDISSACNDMLSKIQLLLAGRQDVIEKYQNLIEDDEAYKTVVKFCEDLKHESEQINKLKKQDWENPR